MENEAWPTPQTPSREPLPRVEDLPVAEQGYEQESVKAAFDSFYRHAAQLDAALRTLELAPLQSKSREPWVVRLRYAYADTLEAAGRQTDALTWFHRTHAIDSQQLTDAAERAEALEKQSG